MTARRRVLVTGAAGKVGALIVSELRSRYTLRLLDRVPIEPTYGPGVEVLCGDGFNPDTLDVALDGIDTVVHLAAHANARAEFDELAGPNLIGPNTLLSAAVRHGVRRVVLAGSNRSVELSSPLRMDSPSHDWAAGTTLHADSAPRPDSLYGVTKAYLEILARYYADTHGLSTICLRLGSVTTRPDDPYLQGDRAHGLWLSGGDLVALVSAAIEADIGVGEARVVFGCSRNTRRWWDLSAGEQIGYFPRDNSEFCLPKPLGHPRPPAFPIPWSQRLAELRPPDDRLAVVMLGQSGVVLSTRDAGPIAIDPFLSHRPDRLQQPLLALPELPVDTILVTHTHRDHLDDGLAQHAMNHRALRIIAPRSVGDTLIASGVAPSQVCVVAAGEDVAIGDTVVSAVAARHRPTTPDAIGFSVRIGCHHVVHCGDTEFDASLVHPRSMSPDLLFVPINGRKGNMTAEQAAALACELDALVTVPMHYGCLQPEADLVLRFAAAFDARTRGTGRWMRMDPGAIAILSPSNPVDDHAR